MGVHKAVNGAYRHRYAPFLMPTYYVKRCSPVALPLGELSPQVTERELRPFSNDNLLGCCLWVWALFALSVLAALGHLSHRERQGRLSRVRLPFCHSLRSATSPKGRGKGGFPGCVSPSGTRYARPPLPRGEARCFLWYFSPSGTRCARPPLPRGEAMDDSAVHQGERQGMIARYTERCT